MPERLEFFEPGRESCDGRTLDKWYVFGINDEREEWHVRRSDNQALRAPRGMPPMSVTAGNPPRIGAPPPAAARLDTLDHERILTIPLEGQRRVPEAMLFGFPLGHVHDGLMINVPAEYGKLRRGRSHRDNHHQGRRRAGVLNLQPIGWRDKPAILIAAGALSPADAVELLGATNGNARRTFGSLSARPAHGSGSEQER